jgi:hypothetical protein
MMLGRGREGLCSATKKETWKNELKCNAFGNDMGPIKIKGRRTRDPYE